MVDNYEFTLYCTWENLAENICLRKFFSTVWQKLSAPPTLENNREPWVEEGKLKPYINQVIKLEQAENALRQLKQGKGGFGKIVVKLL